jgi:hypothetical protein
MSETVIAINARIQAELCEETVQALSDASMADEYAASASVRKALAVLGRILAHNGVDADRIERIKADYAAHIVPPVTKGVLRGNKFNRLVQNRVDEMKLDAARFEVQFEKMAAAHPTEERPDWFIVDKITKKILIGMNQIDLWGGGQQLNRGTKYLIGNVAHNTANCRLMCVVCRPVVVRSEKNKAFKLFKTGFENGTLCYLGALHDRIIEYFEL